MRVTPGSPPQPVQTIGAVAFSSYNRSGQIERQLNARPVLIVFTEFEYLRWQNVWSDAQEVLNVVLDIVGTAWIGAFGIEYQDRFIAEPGSPTPVDLESVLNKESAYLPRVIFDAPDLWHANCGTVQRMETPCLHTRNDTTRVGLVRRADLYDPQLAIEITAQHRRVLPQPTAVHDARQWMASMFLDMHQHNKEIMSDVLTSDAKERIKLSSES